MGKGVFDKMECTVCQRDVTEYNYCFIVKSEGKEDLWCAECHAGYRSNFPDEVLFHDDKEEDD